MTEPRRLLEIEIGEIVLHGLPPEHASYADGLDVLVQRRLTELAEAGGELPPPAEGREVSGATALADVVAQQVWAAAGAQLPGQGGAT